MELIRNIDPEAEKWLLEKDPKTWSRAYFQIDRSCAAFENGISESYHNAIGEIRSKPIITMLEEIRIYLMQRMVTMNKKAVNLNDSVCPSIRKYLTLLNNKQRYWEVIVSGYQEFEVRKSDQAFGVNLASKTCTCKWWILSGLPCVHAVAAFAFTSQDPATGVSSYYKKKMWIDTYSHFIKTVGGSSMWPNTGRLGPLPPKKRKKLGRPRNKRIKHPSECVNEVPRTGRKMTCSNCWEQGHNKSRCYNLTKPKPQIEKRKPGRKPKNAPKQPFNPPKDGSGPSSQPSASHPSASQPADPDEANPTYDDQEEIPISSSYPTASQPDPTGNQSFTGLLHAVEQQVSCSNLFIDTSNMSVLTHVIYLTFLFLLTEK